MQMNHTLTGWIIIFNIMTPRSIKLSPFKSSATSEFGSDQNTNWAMKLSMARKRQTAFQKV